MRELVFALQFAAGTDPVADALATHEDTEVRSTACHVTPENLWRVDWVTGSPAGLEAVERAYLDPDYCADCLVAECSSACEAELLDRNGDHRVFYARCSTDEECRTVPHLALEYLGSELLFETTRRNREYRWRIIVPDEADAGTFNAALLEAAGDDVTVDLRQIVDVESWPGQADSTPQLSAEQCDALAAAVDHGYYEVPRDVELSELADRLDLPGSTLSYRLRRAESELATAFVRS